MSAAVYLTPHRAAEVVCHDEQLRIWAHDDLIGALALGGWLKEGLSYQDQVELEAAISRELRSIIESAFDHPAAKTIMRAAA